METYLVKAGDTLSRIARVHGISLSALLRVNPQILEPDRIVVGQEITIPDRQSSTDPRSTTSTPGSPPRPTASTPDSSQLIFGQKVSLAFKAELIDIAQDIGVDPNNLMAVMAFESGETFSPSIRNPASGATGLIQFMPSTARGLGTSTDALARMTAEEQLDFVRDYFADYRGRLRTLEDTYMAVLWPKGIGKPNDFVLFSRDSGGQTYLQNKGLDLNRDGKITKAEAAAKVREKFVKGEQLRG